METERITETEEALDRAVASFLAGEPLEAPDGELAALVETAATVARAVRVEAPVNAKRLLGDRLAQAAPRERARARRRRVLRPAIALAATLSLATAGFAAALPLAAGSLPSDALYPVKLAGERVRLTLARGRSADARLHLEFAAARLSELERASARGLSTALDELLARYDGHVNAALSLAGDDENLLARVTSALEQHQTTLAVVLDLVPPPAQDAIRRAIDASGRAKERAGAQATPGPPEGKGPPDRRNDALPPSATPTAPAEDGPAGGPEDPGPPESTPSAPPG